VSPDPDSVLKEARTLVSRCRRGRRLILPVILALWTLQLGSVLFRIRGLIRDDRVGDLSTLLSTAAAYDQGQQQFSRFEVFVALEAQSMVLWFLVAVIVTIFGLSLIPLLKMVERLAAERSQS
jgi:hypothetical protein